MKLNQWWRRISGATDAGTVGERLAEAHLARQGYRVLARNWRNPADEREEIDLIALHGAALVFVEVKSRSSRALVPGYYAVNRRKKKVLRRACGAYLRQARTKPHTFRFDVIEVEFPVRSASDTPILRHFTHVPLFPKEYRF